MRLALFAYSRGGCQTARRVLETLPGEQARCYAPERLAEAGFLPLEKRVYGEEFAAAEALIFVGAAGIAVREIAPYVRDKKTDPAVLCLDERGGFIIPLLSGHIGGANALARRVAAGLGATAVITTATDVNGRFSVDTWATEHGCAISDMGLAKAVSAAILEHPIPVCSDFPVVSPLPDGLVAERSGALGIFIGYDLREPFARTLHLTPRVLRVGVGCRKGIAQERVTAAIFDVFEKNGLNVQAISGVYSIDLKQEEPGLLAACAAQGWPVHWYSAGQLKAVAGEFTPSPFVASVTGVDNVCERAAMRGAARLLVKKTVCDGVTVAVAAEHWEVDFGEGICCGHRARKL